MRVMVNGEGIEVEDGATVAALLNQLGLPGDRTVVELSGQVVTREEHTSKVIADGDTVELIRFVGGG
ncbi:MAG: thiamine biosynthesis protein ThiS [Deltaproteobacteria bacterium]|nr:MAG: thiamine biosynthesis protein ThiS [Deltaproteobacteria bacterium]